MTLLLNARKGSAMSVAAADGDERVDARERPRVRHLAADRRGGRRQRAGEERSATLALAALEVAVAGAHRVLARAELVAVHRDAHRAAGLAPLGARRAKDLVQALALGLRLHLLRARDDHHAGAVVDAAILQDARGHAQVADAAVGAA